MNHNAPDSADNRLEESVEYLRDLVENVAELIHGVRPDGSFVYVNRAWRETLGYRRDEIGRLTLFDVIHPADRRRCEELFKRVLSGERLEMVEVTFVAKDGRTVALEGSVSCRFEQGRPVSTRAIYRDVTERKRAAVEREESEAKYRAIFDNAVEGFFQSTPEGRFLTLNPALARIYGYPSPQAVIEHFSDLERQLFVDPNCRPEYIRQIATHGVVNGFEFEISRKDGTRAWVSESARAVLDGAGNLLYYEGTVEDITVRKQMEQALRSSESRYAGLVNNLDGIVWEADARTFQFLFVSPQAERILGYPVDQWLAEPGFWPSHIHPEDRDWAMEYCLDCVRRGADHSFEYRMLAADGCVVWLQDFVSVEMAAGAVIALRGVMVDITERVRAEEERRRLETQIQHAQKLESLGVLAGGIAHDFNNLLTGMLGYASLALMILPDESPACPMLHEIEKSAQRAADLTQQMLAYSGRGKFVIQVVRLDALVHEMIKLLGNLVSKKAALHLDLEPASVEGDATQIRQVIMNLITNASDSLEERNGAVKVRTGVRHADAALLRSPFFAQELPAGDYAYVEVADSGCGMTEETIARIFDPFFTTKFTGRGLGLAAVLGIVKGHQGTIKIDSVPGRGTIFQVLLPCFKGDAAIGRAADAKEPPHHGQGIVLVVEDEPSIRSFVRRVLEGAGFQVREASDGCEGLDLFNQHHQEIVAVLLDLTMPRMDGMEVLRELRLHEPDMPVLVMSGYSELEVSIRFAGLGANGFIQKPFHPRDLIDRLCELLPSKVANDSLSDSGR